jgi:CRISPR/Cas system-associated exonuclease Cas4 (RecB family)
LQEEFGKKIEKGIVETKKKQEEIEITDEMKEKVLEIAEKIREMKDAEMPNNFNKCKNCRLREDCFSL